MHEIIGADLDVPGPFYWARYVLAQGPVANKLVLDGTQITLRGPDAWLAPAGRPWSRIRVPTGATILVGSSPDEPMPGVPPWYAAGNMPVDVKSVSGGTVVADSKSSEADTGAMDVSGYKALWVFVSTGVSGTWKVDVLDDDGLTVLATLKSTTDASAKTYAFSIAPGATGTDDLNTVVPRRLRIFFGAGGGAGSRIRVEGRL